MNPVRANRPRRSGFPPQPPYDPDRAVEIAERIWWVGAYLEGDPFQCHVYLIENGDESVLIDPGSPLTFGETRRKIETIIPFGHIRYFVCQHQDPDIVAAIGLFHDGLRDDALIVTHWRSAALIRHYGWHIPMRHVDDCDWELRLGQRVLKFVAIPYLHFPGAICTFDESSGVLFSSDLFGGFTSGFRLFAEDEAYFDAMRPFHEHYMPSREILQNGLIEIQRHPVRMIAPQHGSIIPAHLAGFMIEKLKTLDCGLLASAPGRADVARLSRLNHVLAELRRSASAHCGLGDIARAMLQIMRGIVPEVHEVELWALDADGRRLSFSERSHFRACEEGRAPAPAALLGRNGAAWMQHAPSGCRLAELDDGALALVMPLVADDRADIGALLLLRLSMRPAHAVELDEIARHIAQPLRVSVERELLMHALEQDRRRYYQQSIRDTLTGLFTRFYMDDAVNRMIDMHARKHDAGFGVVLFDIDRFKHINDSFGHASGDEVLRRVAALVLSEARKVDIPVRLGGEEFAVFLADTCRMDGVGFAERVCLAVRELRFEGILERVSITISAGFADHRTGESLDGLLGRADLAMYEAKHRGRDRVCAAP